MAVDVDVTGLPVAALVVPADAGAPVVTPPHDAGNNNRNAVVRDPEGTLAEFVAKRS
ncbi:VOC family protein [Nocardioides sp. zg-1228]|uniref:VOC family protein n=1 Tax=Nocardioides sp. zg-1228 TaxID=2763008 RepID=UPI001643645D|nr:hypothetical protein [Nocardioides sp. zg-1228]MBC2935082.1 hypothetical protein [Nocardioides sp. zg-1228]QSF56085.1 hypothetical protein JX575_10355 [Nocardioides sp. zg-1228]